MYDTSTGEAILSFVNKRWFFGTSAILLLNLNALAQTSMCTKWHLHAIQDGVCIPYQNWGVEVDYTALLGEIRRDFNTARVLMPMETRVQQQLWGFS